MIKFAGIDRKSPDPAPTLGASLFGGSANRDILTGLLESQVNDRLFLSNHKAMTPRSTTAIAGLADVAEAMPTFASLPAEQAVPMKNFIGEVTMCLTGLSGNASIGSTASGIKSRERIQAFLKALSDKGYPGTLPKIHPLNLAALKAGGSR